MQRLTAKTLLTSGTDEQALYTQPHRVRHPFGEAIFTVSELTPLHEAEKQLSAAVLAALLGEISVEKSLISYRSDENLQVYLLETPEVFVVISAGESQPGLHAIYSEGVFSK